MTTNDQEAAERCAWCAAPASHGQTHCSACGASLVQRETIGELVIPGVTHVDPNLQSYAAQPMRIAGARPSQSAAAGMIEAVAAGGGPTVAALGAVAAMAATEYLSAGRTRTEASASFDLGQPSEAVLEMVQRLDNRSAIGPMQPMPIETFEEMLKRLDARLAPDAASKRGSDGTPADRQ